jgi:hypothetical protein
MTGGVVGCTAALEKGNGPPIVKIGAVKGKGMDIFLKFDDKKSAEEFATAFKVHHDYYTTHKIPSLKLSEW